MSIGTPTPEMKQAFENIRGLSHALGAPNHAMSTDDLRKAHKTISAALDRELIFLASLIEASESPAIETSV